VSPSAVSRSAAAPGATPVRIKLLDTNGATYGVGMPVVALFSERITSGRALQQATTATANGRALAGAWYFERSTIATGYPIEGHWRPENYWPAHAKIHLNIPAKGLSAGRGFAFADDVTLTFDTGAEHIAVVNDVTHTMTVRSDGQRKWTFPVSLGANRTPTRRGVKVIMEKLPSVCMHGVDGSYYECGVKLDQRLTYDGEYLHSAPWNVYNIEHGIDSSNGCTNLLPADAALLYKFLKVGDVVEYPNADGRPMAFDDGYGDWNIPWRVWVRGGIVPS
jgi:lipoprotein-anchoring transpeptidase ErfK/SrfK